MKFVLKKNYYKLMKDKINILNVEIEIISEQELLQQLRRGVLITPNVDQNYGRTAAIQEERRMAV